MSGEGVLGIWYWTTEDQKIHYRCSGNGSIYAEFYKWIKTTSYECTSTDFPWDFFVFKDPADEATILERYSKSIFKD